VSHRAGTLITTFWSNSGCMWTSRRLLRARPVSRPCREERGWMAWMGAGILPGSRDGVWRARAPSSRPLVLRRGCAHPKDLILLRRCDTQPKPPFASRSQLWQGDQAIPFNVMPNVRWNPESRSAVYCRLGLHKAEPCCLMHALAVTAESNVPVTGDHCEKQCIVCSPNRTAIARRVELLH
jgi:hypothetical protein